MLYGESPGIYVPKLTELSIGKVSLGVPVENGAVQLSSPKPLEDDQPRIQVEKFEGQTIDITREDGSPLQVEAGMLVTRHILKRVSVLEVPVERLTLTPDIDADRGHMWVPHVSRENIAHIHGLFRFIRMTADYAVFRDRENRMGQALL